MRLENVILPSRRSTVAWDITVEDGLVRTIQASQPAADHIKSNNAPSLLLPALCHPHVHLDKPYILTGNHAPCSPVQPRYSDLAPRTGSFGGGIGQYLQGQRALHRKNLYLRGSQLLATSYGQGVSSLRAFVELGHVTGNLLLVMAMRLEKDFSHLMHVQDFSSEDYAHSVDVLGTTPYVEQSTEASQQNIEWAATTALEPLAYSVLELLQKCKLTDVANKSKTIVLGHRTQLSVLSDSDFKRLAESIKSSKLPIHFVGLPTSDLFMMGRPNGDLASWAVGIYQAGIVDDAHILYECVSGRAREAIGLDSDAASGDIFEGEIWRPKLRVQNPPAMELPSVAGGPLLRVEARPRRSLRTPYGTPLK
ncbi:hypothetical protein DL765_010319 [Monosporascus sp. GIB2]|nr:hypothetical protein DL765_010319 [Monosporascus sp. GIB2]